MTMAEHRAPKRFEMGFYDVGNLYDTIRSNFYNDRHYTPKGAFQWSTARYNRKVRNIAAAIDSLNMPIVAIHGIETKEVLNDILRASKNDYCSIHTTIDFYNNGLDLALIYFADMFTPEHTSNNGYMLYICGTTHTGERVAIHLTTRGYKILTTERPQNIDDDYQTVEEMHAPVDITIAWGGFEKKDFARLGLEDALTKYPKTKATTKGDTFTTQYNWHYEKRIGVLTTTKRKIEAATYIKRWLLSPNQMQPEPTYTLGNRYKGGYSKHLPTYITIE